MSQTKRFSAGEKSAKAQPTAMSCRRCLLRIGLILCLGASMPLWAQTLFGSGGNVPNGIEGFFAKAKEAAFLKAANTILNSELPIRLDASAALPTVDVPPGGPFNPVKLTLDAHGMAQPLAPGDYVVAVTAFCTEYSVHRPGRGVAYKLAPLQGKASGAVATLLWRGMQAGVSPRELMNVAWGIQSGTPYSKMPAGFRADIDRLIPDHRAEFDGDFVQHIEDTYQELASKTKMPPLDQLLAKLGKPGELFLTAKRQREALESVSTSDEIKSQTLFAGQESAVYTPIKAEVGPWTVQTPGVAYMRYKIEGGNLANNNIMEIRIVSANAPTLLGLLGVSNSPDRMNATGLIGYAQGQGAQALIPVLPLAPPISDQPISHSGSPAQCSLATPQAQRPMAGDVIIYRAQGRILHSGVVARVDNCKVMKIKSYVIAWKEVRETSPDDPALIADLGGAPSWTVYRTSRPQGNNVVTVIAKDQYYKTDAGNEFVVKARVSNCHGYTFTSSEFFTKSHGIEVTNKEFGPWEGTEPWLAIDLILHDNQYSYVPALGPADQEH